MSHDKQVSKSSVAKFLETAAKTPVTTAGQGRLVFALDATASREATWDTACHLQAEMFAVTEALGGLSVQLCYYRGFNEFHSGAWCTSARQLTEQMTAVRCLGGHTQIARVLKHAQVANREQRIQAVIYVGDAMEENPDTLCHLAGKLGVLGIPVFMFQEGDHSRVRSVYQQIAQLTGGAFAPFNLASRDQLRQLLEAVAVFTTGGRKALEKLDQHKRGQAAGLLLEQFKE